MPHPTPNCRHDQDHDAREEPDDREDQDAREVDREIVEAIDYTLKVYLGTGLENL